MEPYAHAQSPIWVALQLRVNMSLICMKPVNFGNYIQIGAPPPPQEGQYASQGLGEWAITPWAPLSDL